MLKLIAEHDPSMTTWNGRIPEDTAYEIRNRSVVRAVSYAQAMGMAAGFKHHDDPEFGEWNIVAYINLPTGQVSWHLPAYPGAWDGHTTDKKYERIFKYVFGGAQ